MYAIGVANRAMVEKILTANPEKRITIDKGDEQTFHRAFLMDLVLEGDLDLIKFAYDAGLGEKSGLGFGMVDLIL